MECISLTTTSMLVNGNLTDEFRLGYGGDDKFYRRVTKECRLNIQINHKTVGT